MPHIGILPRRRTRIIRNETWLFRPSQRGDGAYTTHVYNPPPIVESVHKCGHIDQSMFYVYGSPNDLATRKYIDAHTPCFNCRYDIQHGDN